ncbi:PREDICTED: uncharacterized protein LOC109212727 [Nicotiana attenuata]|uniref:uncharacterized protein LOC109212727 n=1 Tax=Nicotiana attenuata TaxID=49451 RepID=UPI000904A932|nr:PREDICTED: uncharacterized protein LOC109212727 [Nicotiana attenuata]
MGDEWQQVGGKYSIQKGYIWRKGEMNDWPWARWIWNSVNVPKHSFINRLAMHKRLLTRERLEKLGVCTETRCEMCGGCIETIQHLFFECHFSEECLKILKEWLGLRANVLGIDGIWQRLTRNVKGTMCRKLITAVVATLVYKIWQARNDSIWNGKVPSPVMVCKQIQQECKIRLNMQNIRKEGRSSREWIENLYSTEDRKG